MNEDFRYGAQNVAGQASRSAGKMIFTGLVQGFKVLFRFGQEMLRMFLGK